MCVSDENLANDATRFLLDLYYGKQPNRTRRQAAQTLHEGFLKEAYTRLSNLLSSTVPLPSILTSNHEHYYRNLKACAEQLLPTANTQTGPSTSVQDPAGKIDHKLWLQKIERLLMVIEEYVHIVEHEPSPTAHITSFHGFEYQIRIVLGELGKSNCPYDVAIVHSNDTLEMLRTRLGLFYKVPSNDIHISIQNTRPLPQSYDQSSSINNAIALPANNSSFSSSVPSPNNNVLGSWLNSKYLYQVYVHSGTTIYIKILGSTYNQPVKAQNTEPVRLYLSHHPRHIDDDHLSRTTPSNMMGDNVKVYDVLYQLAYLNNKHIHQRIRNLFRLLPSDVRILDLLDHVSARAANACTMERRQSTENATNNPVSLNPKQAIERVFNFHESSLIQVLYNLEILSSKISPLSSNIGIKQSSKLFRQDFIEQAGVEYLFKLLNSLNQFTQDEYQYSLCEEMTILILQLVQLLLCGSNSQEESTVSRPASPVAVTASDASAMDTIDFDFQATVEHLQFEEFVGQIKQLVFLCWAAAAGNIRLQEQTLTIKEQVKLDRHALLQQINSNIFSRNNSKSSSSSDSSMNHNVQKVVQFGICVKKDSILPLDGEIAEKTIDIVMFCFEKRPEYIGKSPTGHVEC